MTEKYSPLVGRKSYVLGDAAHPMLPYLAQGACQAIEDAAVLGRCLENWSEDPVRALSAYESLRRPRTSHVQQVARDEQARFHITDLDEVRRRNAGPPRSATKWHRDKPHRLAL